VTNIYFPQNAITETIWLTTQSKIFFSVFQ